MTQWRDDPDAGAPTGPGAPVGGAVAVADRDDDPGSRDERDALEALAGLRAARTNDRPWARAVRQALLGGWAARAATVFLLVSVLASVFAGVLAQHDPNAQDAVNAFASPSGEHWFGTDDLGRDVFSRLVHGAGQSLQASAISVLVALAIGIPVGLLAGLYGKFADEVLMRVVDTLLAFPSIVLAMTVIAILGGGLTNAMVAVGIVFSPIIARLLRGQVLHVKGLTFVEAASTFGSSRRHIIVRHLLPNCIQPVIVQSALLLALGLLAEASLSFLGLGITPPDASWGSMLGRGYRYMHNDPMLIMYPGAAIFLTSLSFNVIGDGFRSALDPKSLRR